MSCEKQFDQPCSPVQRPIKFRQVQGQIIFQCSSETGANASISKNRQMNAAPTPQLSIRKHNKLSVLSFLSSHERRSSRTSNLRAQVS